MSVRRVNVPALVKAVPTAVFVSAISVLAAAIWMVGKGFMAQSAITPPTANFGCESCTLHHRDISRMRELLKDKDN